MRKARFFIVAFLVIASSSFAAENDLSVGWIARLPRIDYVWGSTNPTSDGSSTRSSQRRAVRP